MVTPLPPHEIHLYYQDFTGLYRDIEKYQSLLSVDEKQRAAQFHFEADRQRFIIARGALRSILAAYLKHPAQTLLFNYGAQGKPFLQKASLQFNVSHTKEAFLIACHCNAALGVDLELMTRQIDYQALGKQILSSEEYDYFISLPSALQGPAFFRAWTRKEAFIKALGLGLSIDLKKISTTTRNDPHLTLQHADKTWQVMDLPSRENHCLALAIESAKGGGDCIEKKFLSFTI